MGFTLSEKISEFMMLVDCAKLEKSKLTNNIKLTNDEFDKVSRLCEILTAIGEVSGDKACPPSGGEFWHRARLGLGPYGLHVRRDRHEIDHMALLNTRFRDFSTMAYESDTFTPKPDFWVRRYRRLAGAVPAKWQVHAPARFGEIGWKVDGYPVNRLTSINQERINAMMIAGITDYLELQSTPRILEIGAGAGELGYVFNKALPGCTWYDSDLLGCLAYSTLRLSVLLPEKNHYVYVGDLPLPSHLDERFMLRSPEAAAGVKNAVVNIPHFLLDDFVGHLHLHLAYNTYSFAEMPTAAVSHYTALLSHFLQQEGVLFEQNGQCFNEDAAQVVDLLSGTFQQWRWDEFLHGPYRIQNGPTRVWHNNSAVCDKIKHHVNFAHQAKVIESFNDNGDHLDIQFTDMMWDAVAKLLPNSNQIL